MPNDIRPPTRGFSFRDFSASKPNQPLPGDRLDTELDRINTYLTQIEGFLLTSFERDGLLKSKFVSEVLRQPIQEAQASIGTSISSARIAEDMAYRWANKIDGPVFVPNGGDPVDDGFFSAKFHALRASTSATAIASQWADIQRWYFDISTVFYPEVKQLHRHFFSTYYGPFDFPPTQDPFGQPPTAGDLYFNTAVSAMFVWDGDTSQWQAFAGGTSAATFLGLTDTPKSYAGQADKMVVVGPASDRLLFETPFRQAQADARYLNLAGGTLTGPLTLPGNPTAPLHAATKGYVDASDAGLAATLRGEIDALGAATVAELAKKLNLTGGTLTGPLTLAAPPAQPLQAATKKYVDDQIAAIPVPDIPSGIPVGTVAYFAGTTPPDGWLLCNNQAVSTLYPDLRAYLIAAGSPFGTSGSDPRVPELRGEFIRGFDGGRGVDTGRVFGSAQEDAFQLHAHELFGRTHSTASGAANEFGDGTAEATQNLTAIQDPIALGGAGAPRVATETRPRNVALLPCIKAFNGVDITGMADLDQLLTAIATPEEARAGTSNIKLMTPAAVAARQGAQGFTADNLPAITFDQVPPEANELVFMLNGLTYRANSGLRFDFAGAPGARFFSTRVRHDTGAYIAPGGEDNATSFLFDFAATQFGLTGRLEMTRTGPGESWMIGGSLRRSTTSILVYAGNGNLNGASTAQPRFLADNSSGQGTFVSGAITCRWRV